MACLLAVLLTDASEAKAYQLLAGENSFRGTNSTTASSVVWGRSLVDSNGAATIHVLSGGRSGQLDANVSLQRGALNEPSFTTSAHPFEAAIEEFIDPLNPVPEGAIIRATMSVGISGIAYADNFGGNASLDFTFGLGVNSSVPRMIGTSRVGTNNVWTATTNIDQGAFQSDISEGGGKVNRLRLAYRRGPGSLPYFYFSASISGEARTGGQVGAASHAIANAHVNFMLETSMDNGATYAAVRWVPVNTNFLNGIPPRLSVGRSNFLNHIGIVALPLSQHRLQVAPTPAGPWSNFGTNLVLPNLDPLIVTDSESNAMRFYRTIRP